MSFDSASRKKNLDLFASPDEGEGGKPHGESRFAALTAGLLARKGEAEPAFESFKHARNAPGSAREMAPGERHEIDKLAAGESRKTHVEPINDASDVREEWQRVSPSQIEAAPPAPPPPEDAPRMGVSLRKIEVDGKEFGENCPRQKIAASSKRAAVTFRMSVHDFLRLKLASAELETSSQEIIIDAVEAFLDQKGVERLDNCICLAEAAKACGDREAAE